MHIQDFLVPDGSYYIAINDANEDSTLESDLQNFAPTILQTSKTRMVWDNKQFDSSITNFADTLLPLATHKTYATNFFEIPRNSVKNLLETSQLLDLQKYSIKFNIKEAGLDQIEIIRDFMFESFGVKFKIENDKSITLADESKRKRISKSLELALSNPVLKGYLIYDQNDVPCGFFALANLGSDIQLHSVAGLSSYPKLEGVKKLQLIMAATLEVFSSDPNYNQAVKLTFSNSKEKVSQMYRDLGFKNSPTRKGLIIEI